MFPLTSVTEEFVKTLAPNPAAFSNAKKISQKGGFVTLCRSEDNTLLFGDCAGSGKNPYHASVDFSGEAPLGRCSCPSRQFPCKHCLALLVEYTAGKTFTVADIPEDVAAKRAKIEAKAQKAAENAASPKKSTPNKSAATKKLKKQREGLELAQKLTADILSRGICAVTPESCAQYEQVAKQLGDYYLPKPQALMYEIIRTAQELAKNPDDAMTHRVVSLVVKMSATVRKCMAYIDQKLESGEVLPENDPLYEAMGGVWKLEQLKELGLVQENALLMQLAFYIADDPVRKQETDVAFWLEMHTGEIHHTENIRPYKAKKYIKQEDSRNELQAVSALYLYPGGLNRRVRWEAAEPIPPTSDGYATASTFRAESIAAAVKAAKAELKNTLSQDYAAVLLPYDSILFDAEGKGYLRNGAEQIGLCACPDMGDNLSVLRVAAGTAQSGTAFGLLIWDSMDGVFRFAPLSLLTADSLIRL